MAETIYGREREIFSDSMMLIEEALNLAIGDGTTDSLRKRKLSVANHAFSLLWSAWSETGAGRYTAATNHFRSIEESPQYLKALTVRPDLAQKMNDRHVTMTEVKRIVRDALESERPGAGKAWLSSIGYQKDMQVLSHVTREATEATLPIVWDRAGPHAIVRFGGGFHDDTTLRRLSAALADDSLSLLACVLFAFRDLDGIEEMWDRRVKGFIVRAKDELVAIAANLGIEVESPVWA